MAGQIVVQTSSIILTALVIALSMIESVLAKACLVPVGLIALVARITLWGSIVGLALTAVAASAFGVNGALGGLIVGLLLRLGWEFIALLRARVPIESGSGQPTAEPHPDPSIL